MRGHLMMGAHFLQEMMVGGCLSRLMCRWSAWSASGSSLHLRHGVFVLLFGAIC